MTRKLSGLWSSLMANRAPLASLAVVGTLACTLALGCGSSKPGPSTNTDGGTDAPPVTACASPTFAPAAGTVAAGTAVTLTAAGLPTNGFIYYTTDQTMPTHASTFVVSGGTITVSQTETVTAVAYAMGACSDSTPATATYTVAVVADAGPPPPPQCAAPTFMPGAGTVAEGSTVTIVPPADFPPTFPQGNGQIFYTTDGTDPTSASPAYAGPIQVNSSEIIHAIASDPGTCTASPVALAAYTVAVPDGGAVTPPAFNPPSATQNIDFQVHLTDNDSAATICFTFGTGAPTCTVTSTTATCSGTSQTYNAGAGLAAPGSVTINGSVTSATGTVTVNALACAPGGTPTTAVTQTYTLQAAPPTMQGPAPSATLTYAGGPYAPTIASTSTGASIRYTTNGTMPTCTTGTLLTNAAAVPTLTGNTSFLAIACQNGYAPSTVGGPFAYGIVLSAPAFVDATTTTQAEGTGTYDEVPSIDFTDALASAFVCYTADSSAPVCGATAGVCTHGTADNVTGPTAVAITATGTVITAVACSPSYTASAAATATYTLTLDPPALDLPGCTNSAGAATSCIVVGAPTTPVTNYDIPSTAAAMFQPFVEESVGTPPPSAGMAHASYQFACAQLAGTPTCTATGCSAGATLINPTGMQSFQTAGSVPLAGPGVVVAGNVWSVVGCPGSTSGTPGYGFTPSNPTKVSFALPGSATPPAIVAGTGMGTYNATVAPMFTNLGSAAETLCYGTYTVGTPPTMAVNCEVTAGATDGKCGATAGYTASSAAASTNPIAPAGTTTTVAALTVVTPGSGYTSTPTVTISAPPVSTGALQAQATAVVAYSVALPAPTTAGAGCIAPVGVTFTPAMGGVAATATVSTSGTVTGLTVTNAGSGYLTAPTVSFTGCTTPPTVTANLVNGVVTGFAFSPPGSMAAGWGVGYTSTPTVTITGGGATTEATATATLTPLMTPLQVALPAQGAGPTAIDVIGCVAGAPPSAVSTYTYNFAEATPTVVDATQTGTPAVVGASTVVLGDNLTLATTSNFTGPAPSICYTTDGSTPNPACANTVVVGATTTCVANGAPLFVSAANFTTNTLKAIACDPMSQTAQTNSALYSAALNIVVATPTPTVLTGTYYNFQNPTLTEASNTAMPSANAAVCYTTNGSTPTCAAGACTGGTPTYAGGPIAVTTTGTIIKAVACTSAFSSALSTNTYTLSVSPIVIANNPAMPLSYANADCPSSIVIGLDCSGIMGDVCSSATQTGGGATANATLCYSTNGTAVNGCTNPPAGVTCMAGPTATIVGQSTPATINALACASGFLPSGGAPMVTDTAYSNAVAFTTETPSTDFSTHDVLTSGIGKGYFSLTSTTLYIGMDGITPLASTYTVVYIGNGVTNAAVTAPATFTPTALPPAAGFLYAISFPTTGTAATLYQWNAAGPSWTMIAGGPTPVVGTGMATEEYSIPLTAMPLLAGASTITVLGSTVTNAGGGTAATASTFPGGGMGYTHYVDYPVSSCLYPNDPAAIH